MKSLTPLLVFALLCSALRAQDPVVVKTDDVPAITVSPGVILKELTGRTSAGSSKSQKCSVAFFHLDAGAASAWSYTKVAEESFFILKGHGDVWTNGHAQAVEPGSFILIPPKMVRSLRADKGETVEFYAITSPAWSPTDDVMAQPPVGFQK